MRTFSLLKGKPVFDNGGELIGEVCDICIGEDGLVTDLLLLGKGLIGKKYRLPIQSVTSFGNDGVMIDSKNSLVKYYELHDEYTMHHNQPLAKKIPYPSKVTNLVFWMMYILWKKWAQSLDTN